MGLCSMEKLKPCYVRASLTRQEEHNGTVLFQTAYLVSLVRAAKDLRNHLVQLLHYKDKDTETWKWVEMCLSSKLTSFWTAENPCYQHELISGSEGTCGVEVAT